MSAVPVHLGVTRWALNQGAEFKVDVAAYCLGANIDKFIRDFQAKVEGSIELLLEMKEGLKQGKCDGSRSRKCIA